MRVFPSRHSTESSRPSNWPVQATEIPEEPIFLGRTVVQELPPPHDQLPELFLPLVVSLGHRPGRLSEPSDDRGIDPIGLGQKAKGLGEVPHLPRIDHGNVVTGSHRFGHKIPFVPARCLDNGEARSCLRQEREKLRTACGRVVEPAR